MITKSRTLQQAKNTSIKKIVYGTQFYSLLYFFDEPGNISLIVFENGVPMSSPVVKYSLSLPMNSSCALCVALRLNLLPRVSLGSTEEADLCSVVGMCHCARSDPHNLCNIASGCASVQLQCHLNLPLLELSVKTVSALDLAKRTTSPVGLRRHE